MIALISPLQTRQTLVLQHLPRVRSYVRRRFSHVSRESRQDLMAAAIVGLVEAACRFDRNGAVPFWSYARMRVHGAIADALRGMDLLTRTQRRKVRRLERGDTPTGSVGLDALRSCRELAFSCLETETDESFESKLADVEAASPEENAIQKQLLHVVFSWVDALPDQERVVIDGIYRRHQSAGEIARRLRLTAGRISQLHHLGLQHLREMAQEQRVLA